MTVCSRAKLNAHACRDASRRVASCAAGLAVAVPLDSARPPNTEGQMGRARLSPMRKPTCQRLTFHSEDFHSLTHYLFRYPAKFHPPVARALVERFTSPGDTILDPFCGSGTLLVEALVLGRNAIGSDVDPVAAFVSRVKTHRLSQQLLGRHADCLLSKLTEVRRPNSEYVRRQFQDLSERTYREVVKSENLAVPPIPNLCHWFRRYVVVDLARITRIIQSLDLPTTHRDFFMLTLASIIRNASNADPVPISGLEVTSHMRRKDAQGRIINPFALFDRALRRALEAMAEFASQLPRPSPQARVFSADATKLDQHLKQPADAVITSPPYHSAVDYYRRHTLEMYWLRLVRNHEDRISLRHRYIGQSRVSKRNPFVRDHSLTSSLAAKWECLLRREDPERADAFKHYVVAMRECLAAMAARLPSGRPAVLVVGKSAWNGTTIPTVDLFREIGEECYTVRKLFWYPLKNRYMSYSRHNGANIDTEYVIVLERR